MAQVKSYILPSRGSDVGMVEYAVHSIEPAVRAPGEAVGQLMAVVAAKAGEDDLLLVAMAVALGVLKEQHIGGVGDVDAAVPDGDAGGDVQAVLEDRGLVVVAVVLGRFQDLHPVLPLARRARGYSTDSVTQIRP